MEGLFNFLRAQPFFVIFGVVALGMWLGRKAIHGVSLGSVVCIILVGLLTSIAAFKVSGTPMELPDVLKTIFFNLFIFAIGVKIGPQFFSGLERDGWHLVLIGMIVALMAPLLAFTLGRMFQWPQGTMAGVLAGSNNSSATFGAAISAVQSGALRATPGVSLDIVTATLSAAFALCYTVSQVQFVLLMKFLPRLAGIDAPAAAKDFEAAMRGEARRATTRNGGSRRSGRFVRCGACLPCPGNPGWRTHRRRNSPESSARFHRTDSARRSVAHPLRHTRTETG
jgi:putative transport protein